ncbi:hypothetical protein MK280_07715, partial [Myxococcota bacterium]|nr:hypothetical protein [Myxococcota bacterium]
FGETVESVFFAPYKFPTDASPLSRTPVFFISRGELREGFLFLVEREVCILATAPWCAFAFTGHGPGCPMGL